MEILGYDAPSPIGMHIIDTIPWFRYGRFPFLEDPMHWALPSSTTLEFRLDGTKIDGENEASC